MTQKHAWENEYLEGGLPSSRNRPLSQHAINFIGYLQTINLKNPAILDIGCGDGQNTAYFADYASSVCAFDFSIEALKRTLRSRKITYTQHDAKFRWPYHNNQFDAAFDGATFINMVADEEVKSYLSEVYRTLKRNGIYSLVTPVIPDEFYLKLRRQQGVVVTHENGIVQRTYTLDELCQELTRRFKIITRGNFCKQNRMYGKLYRRHICNILLKKE